MNCRHGICFTIAAIFLLAGSAAAEDHTWIGPVGAPWPIANNWNPTGVPGANDTAIINMPGQVVLVVGAPSNPVPTVGNLDVFNGSTLDFGKLNIDATPEQNNGIIKNDGVIRFPNGGILTIRSGPATLHGDGELLMAIPTNPDKTGTAVNFINGQFAGAQLINRQKIHGTGVIEVDLVNAAPLGFVNANIAGQELVLNRIGVDNHNNDFGLFASGGGTLALRNSSVANQGGSIAAEGTGSVIELGSSSEVVGGSLIAQNGGVIRGNGGTLEDVTITGPMEIDAGNLTLTGLVTNDGTTTFVDTNGSSIFIGSTLAGNNQMNLAGTGVIRMANRGDHIRANEHNVTLVHGSLHTTEGFGRIDSLNDTFAIDNRGIIDANVEGEELIVHPGTQVISTNDLGTLRASNGGILLLRGPSSTFNNQCGEDQLCHWDNTGGTIEATGADSVVELDNTRIRGGTLRGVDGGVVANFDSPSAILDAADGTMTFIGTIVAGTAQTILDGKAGSAFDIQGTFLVDSTGEVDPNTSSARLLLADDAQITLTGGGENNSVLRLNGSGSSVSQLFGLTGSEPTLRNDTKISGAGELGSGEMFLDNRGTIIADIDGETLFVEETDQPLFVEDENGQFVESPPFTNSGLLLAEDGGILHLRPTRLENQGLILARAQGKVEARGGRIEQGAEGVIRASSEGIVQLEGGVEITGGSLASAVDGSMQITNTAGEGAGLTDLTIEGTLNALGGSKTFVTGTIRGDADAGGGIVLHGQDVVTTLFARGTVELNGIEVQLRSGTASRRATVTGATDDDSTSATVDLRLRGGASIVGTGVIGESLNPKGMLHHLDVGSDSFIDADAAITGTDTLLVTSHTLTNNGTLRAKAGSTLHLNLTKDPAEIFPASNVVVNRKHIIADGSDAKVRIDALVLQDDNASIKTANGGLVLLEDTHISGGLLDGHFTVDNSSSGDTDLENLAIRSDSVISVPSGNSLQLEGTITNDGLIDIGSAGTGSATLFVFDLVTHVGAIFSEISGSGKILLRNSGSSIKTLGGPVGQVFVNPVGHGIEGAGSIRSASGTLEVTNLGKIVANGQLKENGERTPGDLIITSDDQMLNRGTLTVVGNGNRLAVNGGGTETILDNHGNVEIGPGAVMVIDGTYFAHGGGRTDNRGTMIAEQFSLLPSSPGTDPHLFRGAGFIKGNVENNALVGPGDSPGTLTIEGDYGQNGFLEIELGGTTADSQYDVLAVTGLASFFEGSELQVQLIDDDTENLFQPELGDLFDVVHADTILDQGLVFDFPTLPGLRFAHEIIDTGSVQALRLRVVLTPLCDFSGDSLCDLSDIDDLFDQGDLVAGISAPGSAYDLTGDGTLNGDDVEVWMAEAATENGQASAYLSSDSDLDGDIDLSDFTRLTENFRPGTSGALFSTGDGDGDGDVDLGDYTRLASSFAPLGYTEAAAVPEPNSLVLFSLGGVLALLRRRTAR